MSQKFYNILVVCASLQHIYHVTKVVQAMEATHCGALTLYMQFESTTDEHAK